MRGIRRRTLGAVLALAGASTAHGAVIFQDNFDDGNAAGWSFYRSDAGEWGVLGGALDSSVGPDDRHDQVGSSPAGNPGWALIDGITTPDHFRLSADVRVVRFQRPSDGVVFGDIGHVGFTWGVQAPASAASDFNTQYLRTHSDHVTTWSTSGGSFAAPERVFAVSPVVNGDVSRLSLEVNFSARSLVARFDRNGSVTTWSYTGSIFDSVVRHTGGGIGVINWGEQVSYDNVVLESFDVPEPAPVLLLALALPGLLRGRRRRVG